MDMHNTVDRKSGILYPTMLIAAIAVIIFSVLGIATMTGLMPSVLSKNEPYAGSGTGGEAEADRANPPAAPATAKPAGPSAGASSAGCADCGVVESIRPVRSEGRGTGLGAVAGGLIGGILGSGIGRGGGRTAMTVVGAGAGAYTGNEVEKNMNRSVSYEVKVRMNSGAYRTFYERSPPNFDIGQKVRVTSHGVVAAN